MNWIQRFDTFSFLDNHQYQNGHHSQECLLGAGVLHHTPVATAPALQAFVDRHKGQWIFGHLSYEAPVGRDQVFSRHPSPVGFEKLFFFVPAVVVAFNEEEIRITARNTAHVYEEILATSSPADHDHTGDKVEVRERTGKDEYIRIINQLLAHIRRGDCYEINFCQDFFAEEVTINPLQVYQRLSALSPSPFSALYRNGHSWLLCASPERYLKKSGDRIISQPIKGTSKRIHGDSQQDKESRQALADSRKDRSENVMIVDLVRNDLARICSEGTVKVDELYGVYSFPQVHQMISTISGKLKEHTPFTEILAATFPMGSMTGAPKKKVMELIDQYEPVGRGLFSGTIGYIHPEGDFDFNVIIRSILYNAANKYLSMPAGSGITFYSDPYQEWEECLLKAAAMKEVLR